MPIPLLQETFTELGVALVGIVAVSTFAVFYFRRVRLDRPPIGTFNGRDIGILLTFIIALPFLYAALPGWALTCFLALTFASALSIGYRPLLGRTRSWLFIGLLIGANIWTSRTMLGTVAGWQLWWAELTVLVALAAIAVANLYVQGGMKLRYVAWLALALGAYDVVFSSVYPLTSKLTQEFLGAPLDPSLGMRFGIDNFAIGIGDLQPARDRTSFFINPRSETGPVVYQYAYTMVGGKTPADMPGVLAETFGQTIEEARAVPAGTVGPGYFAPMQVDEFVASRVVEAVVHGLDLTLALGREPIATPEGVALTASILDDLLARRTLGRRPADLADDLAWVLAASGRAEHPDNRLPLIG